MNKTLPLSAALAALLLAAPAFAFHCPAEMKKIDAALAASPKLSAEQLAEVKALRAKGEEQHKAGDHAASLETLGKAEKLLGI
ncbi:hypothetical protein EV699_11452 [Plasticicumulans lactativorans]|uniref:Uncharacterized protein n=1 Tax=Plasticicumulans lactativorans TaxID=1133106 RepID=A0A4R2LC42_9GAMM|nr:hypothetical protein [Plasticicumulans lactativorans]TCO80408.1 hypothetical protein EV699_11452 [Plasticicumulans lactativorans]